jgi:hypothetical protein
MNYPHGSIGPRPLTPLKESDVCQGLVPTGHRDHLTELSRS